MTKKRLNLVVNPEAYRMLKIQAARQDLTMSEVVEILIRMNEASQFDLKALGYWDAEKGEVKRGSEE